MLPWPAAVTLSIIFAILIILALGGNVLVCIAILWDRRLRRQPENLFLISLGVSDLLVSILVMVFAAVHDIREEWVFGQVYCKLWNSFDIMCCTASILNLCAIALDRYWHISKPMLYVRYVNKRRICYSILVVWILSIVLGFGNILFAVDQPQQPDDTTFCILTLTPTYAVVSSFLSFFLPAAIMVLLYTKMYLFARKHVRNIRSQLQAVTGVLLVHTTSVRASGSSGRKGTDSSDCQLTGQTRQTPNHLTPPTNTPAPSVSARTSPVLQVKCDQKNDTRVTTTNNPSSRVESKEVSDQKARVTLGVIMGTFLFCWLPFFSINVVRSFQRDDAKFIPDWLFIVVTWLGYANSSVNPVIYSIFNRDFRRAFRRIIMLTCIVCQRERERFQQRTDEQTQHRFSHSWSERPVNCHRLETYSGNKKYSYMSVDL